jgi:uncharacterized cupredoxin-like copper-binding protein
MNPMKFIPELIASLVLSTLGTAAFSHENTHHTAAAAPVIKEQKAWGIAGEARDVQRTITLRMTDAMRFEPSRITVREGETVRLRAVNRGRVLHEIVLGTPQDLQAHAELMKKHPGMEHDAPDMAHVAAGRRGDIVWNFNRAGTFDFACLIPGHFDAGMIGQIVVTPR